MLKFALKRYTKFGFGFLTTAALGLRLRYKNTAKICGIKALGWPMFMKEYIPFKRKLKIAHEKEVEEAVREADSLFEKGQYLEVYELLNKEKFFNNEQILCRICKALYKMACNKSLSEEAQGRMIYEAYTLISFAYSNHEDNPEVNKWMSIILDAKYSIEGIKYRAENILIIKQHLERSLEFNPEDCSVLYMLGQWYYTLANLTWLQRKIAALLFGPVPIATYQECYKYFLQIEELKPSYFIANTYMLGEVNLCLENNSTGVYYLKMAANMEPKSQSEVEYKVKAQNLLTEIKYFDLHRYGIFTDLLSI